MVSAQVFMEGAGEKGVLYVAMGTVATLGKPHSSHTTRHTHSFIFRLRVREKLRGAQL